MRADMYEVIDYTDVWGNEVDGFEVNNLCRTEKFILVGENVSHEIIIDMLKAIGFLAEHAERDMFDIWDDYEMIEFSVVGSGEPLFRLELVSEED